MGEGKGVGSCPECGTPGSFAGQLVCQGCFVPFALMASAHAAAEPHSFATAPTEPRRRPGTAAPSVPAGRPAPVPPQDSEHTRVINVVPSAPPRPPAPGTRRDVPVHALRLRFPGGQIVEVAAGHGIRLGRDPQLCPAVTFLADRDNLSRIHARIDVEPGGAAWITDEASTNGTFVRGYRLSPHQTAPLRPGDAFRLAADVNVSVLP
jgi:FHA domain-containing protein